MTDRTATEVLSISPFLHLMYFLRLPLVEAGDPLVLHGAGLRRTALKLHSKELKRRIRKAEQLSIVDTTVFAITWWHSGYKALVLNCYEQYGTLHDTPPKVLGEFADELAQEVNSRLDAIDQDAFGGITPFRPEVVSRVSKLFDRIGLELIVVWDALCEYLPDDFDSTCMGHDGTRVLAHA